MQNVQTDLTSAFSPHLWTSAAPKNAAGSGQPSPTTRDSTLLSKLTRACPHDHL